MQFISLIEKKANINSAFVFLPYFRYYLGKKIGAGFFIEGFGIYDRISRNGSYYSFDNNTNSYTFYNDEKINSFGLGIGLGGNWVIKNHIILELNGGFGRFLNMNSNITARSFSSNDKLAGKVAISIGYRF